MSTKQRELLQSQMNAPETDNLDSSNKLIERELIEGTPFWIIKRENEYYLTMGAYKINHIPLKSREEVDKYMKEQLWNIICTVILSLIHNENKINNTQNHTK